MRPTSSPPHLRPGHPDHLAEVLARLAHRHRVPGAQLAVHTEHGAVDVRVGVRTHGGDRPLERDDKVATGSITKALTATVAMILVGDGDLDLDEPVGTQLPQLGVGRSDLGGRLTLRHLLSHTGGLPADLDDHDPAGSSRRLLLDRCAQLDLVRDPGSAFSYSTVGYALVGLLIEAATGMSWREAVETILLTPLAIDPVYPGDPGSAAVPGHAVNPRTGAVRPVAEVVAPVEEPAGALALSARDLVTFGRAHLPGGTGPLDPEVAELMRRPVPGVEPYGIADGWTLGLAAHRHGGRLWLGHDGTGNGTWCHLRIDPVGGVVVALTTTASTGLSLWRDLLPELAHLGLSAGPDALPRQPIPLPRECVGRYVNGDTEFAVLADGDGPPRLAVDGAALAELTVHERLVFTLTELDTGQQIPAGRFLRDQRTGQVDGLQISGRLARRR